MTSALESGPSARPTPFPDAGWRTAAWLVALGLLCVGVALGILYYNNRLLLVAQLAHRDSELNDELLTSLDLANLARVLVAGVFGCSGVALTGFGAVMVLARCRWFEAHPR